MCYMIPTTFNFRVSTLFEISPDFNQRSNSINYGRSEEVKRIIYSANKNILSVTGSHAIKTNKHNIITYLKKMKCYDLL